MMKLVLLAACAICAQAKPGGTEFDAEGAPEDPVGRSLIGDAFQNTKHQVVGNRGTNLNRTKTIYLVFSIMA